MKVVHFSSASVVCLIQLPKFAIINLNLPVEIHAAHHRGYQCAGNVIKAAFLYHTSYFLAQSEPSIVIKVYFGLGI
jgi:hypothetical protein